MLHYGNINILFNTRYKIENGNGECVKETITRPENRQQQKVTNRSSMQRETPAPGGVLQLAHKQISIVVQYERHTKLRIIHKKLKLKLYE